MEFSESNRSQTPTPGTAKKLRLWGEVSTRCTVILSKNKTLVAGNGSAMASKYSVCRRITMPFDAFMKIGDIQGEAKDKKHRGEIDVLSFHWSAMQVGTWSKGGGGGAGKVQIENFAFVKRIDRSTPVLFIKCCSGEHIPSAVFTVRKAGGTQIEYLNITFTDILITSVRPGGASTGPDEIPLEEVTFDFAQCEINYTEQNVQGHGAGRVRSGWNLLENVKV